MNVHRAVPATRPRPPPQGRAGVRSRALPLTWVQGDDQLRGRAVLHRHKRRACSTPRTGQARATASSGESRQTAQRTGEDA
jgi:hypothetical protein